MGQVFAAEVLGLPQAQVGLLNIGEEPGKGTPAVIEAHQLLAGDPVINFYGNVEGRDLMNRVVDVIVTDGFTGNVALKSSEGAARAILSAHRQALSGGSWASRLGALLVQKRPAACARDARPGGVRRLVPARHERPRRDRARQFARSGHRHAVLMGARASSGLLPAIAARLGESAVRRDHGDGAEGATETDADSAVEGAAAGSVEGGAEGPAEVVDDASE